MSAASVEVTKGDEGVNREEVYEAAKKMMGREFQHVLAALLKILPDYEDMLVKSPLLLSSSPLKHTN